MRRTKRTAVPAGAFISLGTKPKRPAPSSHGPTHKSRGDTVEVTANELVGRTETALSAGNTTLAESLILSALNQLRTHSGPSSAASTSVGFRSNVTSTTSRLLPGFSVGLLVLAQAHPTLFSRPSVHDQLVNLLASSPRDLGIALPPAAVVTIANRVRGLHVLVANLLYLALEHNPKWPSQLVRVYLDDCLTDRVWVDQEECRLFVLNLETAFPKTIGDPRGLFTVLANPSSSTPTTSNAQSTTTAVHHVLGLVGSKTDTVSVTKEQDEIAEAVSTVLRNHSSFIAKTLHGSDFTSRVTPRFESCRQAVEVMIINTLREALGRRGSASQSHSATTASSGSSTSSLSQTPSAPGIVGEVTQLRNLIRTTAMAVGMAEIRGLATNRLEPWLTNPKVQLFTIGLTALLATNCRLGALSAHDLELIVSLIYRIRYKLLKPNIQTAFLECITFLVKASPTNLYTLIHLCGSTELRPALPPDVIESKQHMTNYLTEAFRGIADAVQGMISANEVTPTPPSQQQLNSAAMVVVAAGTAVTAANRSSSSAYSLLPYLYQRFPLQWIRVVGSLLHERLLSAATSCVVTRARCPIPNDQLCFEVRKGLTPLYQFLRELSRFWRPISDLISGSGSGNPPTSQLNSSNYLPCAELAAVLLHDRAHRGSTTVSGVANAVVTALLYPKSDVPHGSGHIGTFQFYLSGIVSLLGCLQMLSTNRPHLNATASVRRPSQYLDAMKAHQITIRQIRLSFIRWIKTILPPLINASMQTVNQSTGAAADNADEPSPSAVITCFDALQPALHIRRALMLESSSPLHQSVYVLSPYYPTQIIWANEPDTEYLIRMVTDTSLPEKLALQLLILGLEPTWQLLNPLEALDIVCELIWRAAALSQNSGLDTLNIIKVEQLIDLMFTSCAYIADHPVPPEMTELAHASAYWKVSISAVILAAQCPQTCGLFFWSNYPTIRRLIGMVITDEYLCPTQTSFAGRDASVLETEQLNAEMELQLILQLETFLLNPPSESNDSPRVHVAVTAESSKLIGRLVRNNPRGPCRLPPTKQIELFKSLADSLKLGQRLWRSREPDFLLELIRTQVTTEAVQPWLVRLVESSRTGFEMLPLQCLCEYLLCGAIARLQSIDCEFLPSINQAQCGGSPCAIRIEIDTTSASATESGQTAHRNQLITRVREELRMFSNSSAPDALVHSFFRRLSDRRSVVRCAVRQCLRQLILCERDCYKEEPESVHSWLTVLQELSQLPTMRNDVHLTVDNFAVTAEPFQHLLSAISNSLLIESDLDILTGYLIFLDQVTTSPTVLTWLPVITGLTHFINTRSTTLLTQMLHQPSSEEVGFAALEAMAGIFVRYVNYNCTAGEPILVHQNKSAMVAWPNLHQCPLELDCIQAQLLLLTHVSDVLPTETTSRLLLADTASDETCRWMQLRDVWFVADQNTEGLFVLPSMTLFTCPTSVVSESTISSHLLIESVDGTPRVTMSEMLRRRLLQTNEPKLTSAALYGLEDMSVMSILRGLPTYMLNSNTASLIYERVQTAMNTRKLSNLDASVERAIKHLQRRISQTTTKLHSPMDTSDQLEKSATSVEPKLEVSFDESFWIDLPGRLADMNHSSQAGFIFEFVRSTRRDPNTCSTLLSQFEHDLTNCDTTALSPKRVGRRKPATKAKIAHMKPFYDFISAASTPSDSCHVISLLLSTCFSLEPEPKSIGKRITEKMHKPLSDEASPCEFRTGLQILHSALFPSMPLASPVSVDTPISYSPLTPSSQDAICLFGVGELSTSSLVESNSSVWLQIFGRPASYQPPNTYLVTELLNQAEPALLRQSLSFLLGMDSVHYINPSYVLDYILAMVNLPRLTYSVPRSEPRARPDQTSALAEFVRLSPREACQMCNLVLIESVQSLNEKKQSDNSELLKDSLSVRIPMLDLAMKHCPSDCIAYLEFVALSRSSIRFPTFLSFARLLFTQLNPITEETRVTAQRLLRHLYYRWPGLFSHFKSLHTILSPQKPDRTPLTEFNLTETVNQPEVDRVGDLILLGLTATNLNLAEVANWACATLAAVHTRTFIRLLPMLTALTEGEFGWDFTLTKRLELLYSRILHLVELLSHVYPLLFDEEFIQYGKHVDQILAILLDALPHFQTRRSKPMFIDRLSRVCKTYGRCAAWLTGPLRVSNLQRRNPRILDTLDRFTQSNMEFHSTLSFLLSEISATSCGRSLSYGTGDEVHRSAAQNVIPVDAYTSSSINSYSDQKAVMNVLEKLDTQSKFQADVLIPHKTDLEYLINVCDDPDVGSLIMSLLVRLLGYNPLLAFETIQNVVLPQLSLKLSNNNRSPRPWLLSSVPALSLLCPQLAPSLLLTCSTWLLVGQICDNPEMIISSVEESVRQLTLDGLDDVAIEHAASALVRRTNDVRGS